MQGELMLQDDLPNNEFTTRFYDDGRVIESQVPENREQYHYTVRLGADWKITPASALTISGIYDFERHVDVAAEGLGDLGGLVLAQEAVVDEDAGELVADRLVDEKRGDR